MSGEPYWTENQDVESMLAEAREDAAFFKAEVKRLRAQLTVAHEVTKAHARETYDRWVSACGIADQSCECWTFCEVAEMTGMPCLLVFEARALQERMGGTAA